MCILKVKYTEFKFLTLQQFHLPNGLPGIRPGSAKAMAPVFLQNKGNCVGFTKPLFRRMFIHCAMALPFILY